MQRPTPSRLSAAGQLARDLGILVAVPVFNEETYLPTVLPEILERAGDVLVIDDGSTDATPQQLAELDAAWGDRLTVIRHPQNAGYGQSLIDAFQYAAEKGYCWVVTIDCDEQHDPDALSRFYEACAADDADIVSGTRYNSASPNYDDAPADRRQINRALTTIINHACNLQLTDSFCGYKAHRVAAMRRLNLSETGYAFPVQLWPRVAAAGLRVVELSVRRIYKDASRHFGGGLDNPEARLWHYVQMLSRELARAAQEVSPAATDEAPCWMKRGA